jgi:integrase
MNQYREEELLSEPENEQEMIEWSPDFLILTQNITYQICKIQKGHYNTGIDILARVLNAMFGTTSYSKLYERSSTPGTAEDFSVKLSSILEKEKFKKSTCNTVLYSVKKILSATALPESFISRICIKGAVVRLSERDPRNCLPKKYKDLDTKEPVFKLLMEWILKLRKNSRLKSASSIKQLLYFIIPTLQTMGHDIDTWNIEKTIDIQRIKDLIIEDRHFHYASLFFKCIFNIEIPEEFKKNDGYKKGEDFIAKSDEDTHRISADELDIIYEASKSDIRTELMVLLLTTTGMRIGGMANIKIQYISKILNGNLVINDIGKTIEKGTKWFSFNMNAKLKSVIWDYITNHRKANFECDYLFVGRGGGLTTNRMRDIINETIKKSGLSGSHLHPHAFRHSFAHILLECGNTVDCVSKMMGHSSIKTTESYYLKESAAEVSKRSNVPWLDSKNKIEKIVPNFLSTKQSVEPEKLGKQKDRLNRKRERNNQLKELSKTLSGISILDTVKEN